MVDVVFNVSSPNFETTIYTIWSEICVEFFQNNENKEQQNSQQLKKQSRWYARCILLSFFCFILIHPSKTLIMFCRFGFATSLPAVFKPEIWMCREIHYYPRWFPWKYLLQWECVHTSPSPSWHSFPKKLKKFSASPICTSWPASVTFWLHLIMWIVTIFGG